MFILTITTVDEELVAKVRVFKTMKGALKGAQDWAEDGITQFDSQDKPVSPLGDWKSCGDGDRIEAEIELLEAVATISEIQLED